MFKKTISPLSKEEYEIEAHEEEGDELDDPLDNGEIENYCSQFANFMEGNGSGVLLVSLEGGLIPLSFKLEFEATNNVVDYEYLLLGLQTARNINIGCLTVFGDSELVVKQIRNQCQAKHPRLKAYRNEVWDMIDNLFSFVNTQFLPRDQNRMADSLVVAASNFKPPQNPLLRYEVEVGCRPSLPDNVKH
eukprot:PITA_10726